MTRNDHTCTRPLGEGDGVRLARMFGRLSKQSVHRRFFTLRSTLDGPLLEALTSVDHDRHEALVVAVGDDIVALASYNRRPDESEVADIAVVVEDDWQGLGLGRDLVRAVVRLARSRGVKTLHADVLAENRPVINLIHRLDPTSHGRFENGAVAFDLPLVRAA